MPKDPEPPPAEDPVRFARWIARPQSLIALSAVLLSLCGLFIAVYEAALIRRQQRASAWPYVHVAASMTGERIQIWVQNAGVGPARVRAAAVSHNGETRRDWEDLLRRAGADAGRIHSYYSPSSLQDVMRRSRGTEAAGGERAVDSCEGEPRSAI